MYRRSRNKNEGWHYVGDEKKGKLYPLFVINTSRKLHSYSYHYQFGRDRSYRHLFYKYDHNYSNPSSTDLFSFRYCDFAIPELYDNCVNMLLKRKLHSRNIGTSYSESRKDDYIEISYNNMTMIVEGSAPAPVQYFIFYKLFEDEIKQIMAYDYLPKKAFDNYEKKDSDDDEDEDDKKKVTFKEKLRKAKEEMEIRKSKEEFLKKKEEILKKKRNIIKWNIYNGKDPSRTLKDKKEEKDFKKWLDAGGLEKVRILKNEMGEYCQILPNNIVPSELIKSIRIQQERQWLVSKGLYPLRGGLSVKQKEEYRRWVELGGYNPDVYIPYKANKAKPKNERSCFKCYVF